MAHAVFISHAAPDKTTAEAVCRALEDAGVAWIAPRDVLAGTRYAEAIVGAVRESQTFVLVFSTAANASAQVEREVDRAASLGLPIVPFRIEEVVPSSSLEYYLAGQHWLDAVAPPLEEHLAGLVTAVRSLTAAIAEDAGNLGAPAHGEGAENRGVPSGNRRSRAGQERRGRSPPWLCDLRRPHGHQRPETLRMSTASWRSTQSAPAGEIEAHGGTVERSIGDAVVGVFGAPAVHEDDAERAVGAGLRLIEGWKGMTASRRFSPPRQHRHQHQ